VKLLRDPIEPGADRAEVLRGPFGEREVADAVEDLQRRIG
jgi:hypothetical protein